jgi:hypothetical protein
MRFTLRASIGPVLLLAPLGLLLSGSSAHAQRGGCMQRQMSGQSSLRSQAYSLPQQSALQTNPYALQQYLQQLQANAFMAQLNGASGANALQLQLNALQQNALALQQSGQLTSSQFQSMRRQESSLTREAQKAQKAALQDQLDEVQSTIKEGQADGTLTAAQLRSLRKQAADLKRQMRSLRAQNTN